MAPGLEVVEEGDGPLVAFLHGALDRGHTFTEVVALLAGEHRTLRYDRRGYGPPVDDPPDVAGHADDLLAILDGRPAIVVGHSFGGVTGLVAATKAPELVRALVLYETPIAWAPTWDDTPMRRVLAEPDPGLAGLRLLWGERYDAMPPDEQALRRARAVAFVAEERSVRLPEPPLDLSAVPVPVVYGLGESGMTAAIVDHLRDQVPDLTVVDVPGADHHAHRTAPAAFAAFVRQAVALVS